MREQALPTPPAAQPTPRAPLPVRLVPRQPQVLSLTYRPALEGLRAVAVYLVVAFHAGLGVLPGGFVGVDTFFVLSGYLVTRLLLAEGALGRPRLARFYARRVLRLLPAATLTLATVSAVWVLIAAPRARLTLIGQVRSAALYFANWHFAASSTDYFAREDDPTPLLHFWSLSVEEQFYLVWPVLLLVLCLLCRGNTRRLLRLTAFTAGLLSVGSLVALALTVRGGNLSLAYYGTHTRAYQLLVGALMAVWLCRAPRRAPAASVNSEALQALWPQLAQAVGLVTLIAVATPILPLGQSMRGVAATAAVATLIAGCERSTLGPTAGLLSLPLLTRLGALSYATYLWHYPVIVVLQRFVDVSALPLFLTTVVVATGLAALSQQLLEYPVRRAPRLLAHPRPVVAGGLALSLLSGAVLLPVLLHDNRPPAVLSLDVAAGVGADAGAGLGADAGAGTGAPAPATAAAPGAQIAPAASSVTSASVTRPPARIRARSVNLAAAEATPPGPFQAGVPLPDPGCIKVAPALCTTLTGTAAGKKVLVMGDSHAEMLMPALRAIAVAHGLTLSLASFPGCPWMRSLVYVNSDQAACRHVHDVWYRSVIPTLNPDVIVLATRATDHASGASYSVRSVDPRLRGNESQLLAAGAKQSLLALARTGRTLIVEEPVPVSPVHALDCLSSVVFVDQCAFRADPHLSPAEVSYRQDAATIPGVRTLNLDPLICTRLPVCQAFLPGPGGGAAGGVVVRKDHDHLTGAVVARIEPAIERALHAMGVF